MERSTGAASAAAFSFTALSDAVRSNPGAVLKTEDGRFSIQLVPAKGRPVTWMKLEEAARPDYSPTGQKAQQQQRQSIAPRFAVTPDGKGHRISLKPGQQPTALERGLNRMRNAGVAEAFVRQIQLSEDPGSQVLKTRAIRERLVELPPQVFASELALIADGSGKALSFQEGAQRMRASLGMEFEQVPGFASASAATKEKLLATAMALWADEVAAGVEPRPEPAYVDSALNAMYLPPLERRGREAAISGLQQRLHAAGLGSGRLAGELARSRNSAPTLSNQAFVALATTLRAAVEREVSAAPGKLQRADEAIGGAMSAVAVHLGELSGLAAQRPARREAGENSPGLEKRQREWDKGFSREVERRAESLRESFGEDVNVGDAQKLFHHTTVLASVQSAPVLADARERFIASQARAEHPIDQAAATAAHLNAAMTALLKTI